MSGDTRELSIQDAFRARLQTRPALVYGIVDLSIGRETDAATVASLLLANGIDCLQIRGKKIPPRDLERFVVELLPSAHAAGVPLLVNDRVDVALSSRAHGAHVGQDDMPPQEARALLGEKAILGYSTHSLEEVRAAQTLPVDYLGFGAVFPTTTREGSKVAGPQALTLAGASPTLPLIAIGGIVPECLAELPLRTIAGVAAVSAFTPAERTVQALRRFRDTLRGIE